MRMKAYYVTEPLFASPYEDEASDLSGMTFSSQAFSPLQL